MNWRSLGPLSVLVVCLAFWSLQSCQCGPSVCESDADCFSGLWKCVKGKCEERDGGLPDSGGNTDRTKADDGAGCAVGAKKVCYDGPVNTKGRGLCREGLKTCLNAIKWSVCQGQVLPAAEVCGDNKDNDCDGLVDEGCKPKKCEFVGRKLECFTGDWKFAGKGVCKLGIKTCNAKLEWGPCVGQVLPGTEACSDGKDNDCDGLVDEGCGNTQCKPGQVRDCYPSGTPGCVKQGNFYNCKGICKEGKQKCNAAGRWGACASFVKPRAETCNSFDDDCNGLYDDNVTRRPPCSRSKGVCAGTLKKCGAAVWVDCNDDDYRKHNKSYQSVETRCDKLDNDCDGLVDEGCQTCTPGLRASCYTGPSGTVGKGPCRAGVKVCNSRGLWGGCSAQIVPTTEICDGKDNDCNGLVDEKGCGAACTPGVKRACYSGPSYTRKKGRCRDGVQVCGSNRKWGACAGEAVPINEICNKVDDDCDGFVDEDFPEQLKPCKTGRPGICADGTYQCPGGKLACLPYVQPRIEICNGKDDNCNGKIDDGANTRSYYRDSDGDGYGDPKAVIKACRRPTGYVENNTDCYDKNRNVFPGQPSFFSTQRGDGSFDYNCDGKASPRFGKVGSCNACKSPIITQGYAGSVPACGKSGGWITSCRFDVGKCYPNTAPRAQTCR